MRGPEVIEDGEMFRVRWSDGEISDYTNETRTKEAIRRFLEREGSIDARMPLRASKKPAGEFNGGRSYHPTLK